MPSRRWPKTGADYIDLNAGIFVDPLMQPVSVVNSFGMEFINAIKKIVANFPGIHTACGLSNIS